ncbi:MAG: hypothetical protein ACFCD0_14070 [Gemmataceae bacterium]
MANVIVKLLELFWDYLPDKESSACVLELAQTPGRWSAGHAVFDEIRSRLVDTGIGCHWRSTASKNFAASRSTTLQVDTTHSARRPRFP